MAVKGAYEQWRTNVLQPDKLADLSKPEHLDKIAEEITENEIAEKVPMIISMDQLFNELNSLADLDIGLFSLHNVNREQELFIEAFRQYKRS